MNARTLLISAVAFISIALFPRDGFAAASPSITTQPQSQSVVAGSNAVFFVVASGQGTLNYQWSLNGTNLADGTHFSGVTNPTLIISNTAAADAGDYQVVVSNSHGSITSSKAILTVLVPAAITGQPTNREAFIGGSAVFSVTDIGTVPRFEQWQKDGTNLVNDGSVNGATTPVLTISNVQTSDDGSYQLIVTNAYGGAASTAASLLVVPVVVWGDNTYGATDVPSTATNAVAVAAGVDFVLALKNDGTVAGWGNDAIPNPFPPAGLSNVVAIAAGGYFGLALKSNGTVVGWGYDGDGETNLPAGLSNVVAVAAGGHFGLALKNDGTIVGWGDNSYGETNPPAGLSNVVAIAAGWDFGLALKSDGTVVGWGDGFAGEDNPPAGLSNVVAIAGGWNFGSALKSDGTVAGWGYDTYGETDPPAGLSNVVAIASGADFNLALKSDGAIVWWGGTWNVTNRPAGLSNVVSIAAGDEHRLALVKNPAVQVPPTIWWQPSDRVLRTGQTTILEPYLHGSLPMTYQWFFNGAPLNGETNRWLALDSIQPGQFGDYQFVAANNYGSVTSSVARISELPFIEVQPSSQIVPVSSNVSLIVVAGGADPLSYQWHFNGTPLTDGGRVSGSTTATLNIANAQYGDGGLYQVVVSNLYGVATSDAAAVRMTYGTPGVAHYVSINSTNPVTPYTSWSTASTNIQAAIDASSTSADDVVLVSPGNYNESLNFNGKPVWLVSVDGPANTVINPSAGLSSITFGSNETSNSIVSGFTIENGGISLSFSSPTIISNTLLHCGTGVNCYFASPRIIDNSISGGGGNGIYLQGADTALVQGNIIQANAGGIGMFAAGSPTIVNNLIQSNQGTAIGMVNQSDANIIQNIIANNTGDGINATVPSGARGPWVFNNTIYGNGGNGIYEDAFISNSVIINNIVVGSPAISLDPWYGGKPPIMQYNDSYSTNGYIYAGITNLDGADNNISVDPVCISPAGGDFHLQSNSPCINSGIDAWVIATNDFDGNPRIVGGTVDIGAYEYQTPVSEISYAWLQQYGLPITTNIDSEDLDGTAFNVYQDWIAGLNPTNALSVLAMLPPVPTNNPTGLVVSWESVSNRTYFLQSSTNLAAQPAFSTIQSNIIGQPDMTSFMDTNAVSNGPLFYRVGVQQ